MIFTLYNLRDSNLNLANYFENKSVIKSIIKSFLQALIN